MDKGDMLPSERKSKRRRSMRAQILIASLAYLTLQANPTDPTLYLSSRCLDFHRCGDAHFYR